MDDLPVGRYGTIHYMSNNGSEVPLASYPVDEPVINLGRSDHNTCHIRLFDRWCSDIHCKLVFEEGKAFLVVLGQNGVAVDGSNFAPSLEEGSPTTVPLTNGSEWLISQRRFIFQYPPKDQRAKLLATPHRKSRRSLRMSMINAAQLWTPSAPKTQAESWQRLKSPVQPFPGEVGTEITVVEGDPVHLSQNQEEVVVVESVESPLLEPEAAPPASARKPPQTPGKRGQANLHRHVLLMNSHRKHTKSVDEQEEREVEESILVEENLEEGLEEDASPNPFIGNTSSRKGTEAPLKLEEPESRLDGSSFTAKSFRASLGAIGSVLPFGRPSGVAHSPNPPREPTGDLPKDQDMEPQADPGQPLAPTHKWPLGSLTSQFPRGEQRPIPRHSMGAGSAGYINLDNDLEQARRRLATLATVERPQMVEDNTKEPPKPALHSARKPRTLPDVPELSSPLPSSKGRFGTAPMGTVLESGENQIQEDAEEVDHTPSRLQRLMRTVENENRRESVRESRQSIAKPAEFYSPASRTSPMKHAITRGKEQYHQRATEMSSRFSNGTHRTSEPMAIGGDDSHAPRAAELGEESDTSAKDSEIHVPTKSKRVGRAPAKQLAPVTGKRTVHPAESPEDRMEIEIPIDTSEDVQMENAEERPTKKARTRKAKTPDSTGTSAAPRARRTTKKVAASVEEDNADEESVDVEENEPVSTSRSRRKIKSEMVVEVRSVKSAATSTRRGGKAKATSVPESVDEDPSGSSVSGLVDSEPPTIRGKGRGRRPGAKAVTEPTGDSVEDDNNDELDILGPPKAPARRSGERGKAIGHSEPDSSLASEDARPGSTTTKAPAKKAPARAKAKIAAVASAERESDSELAAVPKPKTSTKSTRKAVAKEEEEVAEPSLDAKPRRTTRTKR